MAVLVTGFSEDVSRNAPTWKQTAYEVWYRNPDEVVRLTLDNPDFSGQFDVCPYIELDVNDKRRWANVMSANIAWNHCDAIAVSHTDTHGAMYCPIILGSDKTTVSVATGTWSITQLYLSIGNLHNSLSQRVTVRYDDDPEFRKFNGSCSRVNISNPPDTSTWDDKSYGHYRRVIYDLVAFIADYQSKLCLQELYRVGAPRCACITKDLNTASRPRTTALTDQLVQVLDSKTLWDRYGIDDDVILPEHSRILRVRETRFLMISIAAHILRQNCCCATIPGPPRFPMVAASNNGRGMTRGIDELSSTHATSPAAKIRRGLLEEIRHVVSKYLQLRDIFHTTGVRPTGFSLPHFGAPAGLCSSITESRHITAVKKPWRRSNHYKALGQMLRGLAAQINEPDLPILTQGFLADQLHLSGEIMPLITSKISGALLECHKSTTDQVMDVDTHLIRYGSERYH
ncbi:hypothetical protein BGW80DRAFT_1257454 [Lactifluus volemus]|nr:hypothetical protein BGW80DRAFT_1257454 [Lactifluus volemus]